MNRLVTEEEVKIMLEQGAPGYQQRTADGGKYFPSG
jgi:hypothetical protein